MARPAPQRWQKRRSRQWFLAWLPRHVHQTRVELVVASLVVSASGPLNVIVGTDEIGPARVQWKWGEYYSVSAPAYLGRATTFLGVGCGMVGKVKERVSMVGGWKV